MLFGVICNYCDVGKNAGWLSHAITLKRRERIIVI